MKKIKFVLISLCALSFISCVMGTDDKGSSSGTPFPDNAISYTVPEDVKSISFPSSLSGKECYVIYSNEQAGNQYKTLDESVKFNIDDVDERSAENESEFKVYKNAVDFGNGFYRDEIQFNRNDLPMLNSRKSISARAGENASNGQENYYNDHEVDANNKSKFWVFSQSDEVVNKEDFELIDGVTGNHCRIWFCKKELPAHAKENDISIDKNDLSFDSLIEAFDTVFEKETKIFGTNTVSGEDYAITNTGNKKVDILVFDIFGDATSDQKGGTFGYFRPYDFFQNTYHKLQKNAETSNECEVICVDSYFLKKDQDGYKDNNGQTIQTHMVESTIVHEFQHLLNFCNKNVEYSTWFTEMLSMSAEDVFQSQIMLDDDDSPKARFYETFDKPYQGFKNWPKNGTKEVYYAYANAYAFGAYLMRNYGGIDLINLIAATEYIDEDAITRALKMLGYDETFYTVFQKFGTVYINTEYGSKDSLNRKQTQNFGGTEYTLSNINLKNYAFRTYESKAELDYDRTVNLHAVGQQTGANSDNSLYGIFGPRIYKSTYIMLEPIQPYGFTVYYAGQIKSGKTLSIKRKSNLSITVVVK